MLDVGPRFLAFLERIDAGATVAVLCHSDVDGLAAGAILARGLIKAGRTAAVEVTGKGEDAWSPSVHDRLRIHTPGALIVADLGSDGRPLLPGVPTLLIDHHRPTGIPPDAELITGYEVEPTPTSGLIAYWAVQALGPADEWLWIAAISLLSDLGDKAPFPELAAAKLRFKATPLRDATALLNAPRRSASGDARPALDALLAADGPRAVVAGSLPGSQALAEAKAEVAEAFAAAKRAAPTFRDPVALIRIDTPCQIHPLIAQIWRTRLPKHVVIAANAGYLPDRVNFSVRSATGINLLDFLRDRAPADAGPWFGRGHDQATGGSLAPAAWREFLGNLGFDDPRTDEPR